MVAMIAMNGWAFYQENTTYVKGNILVKRNVNHAQAYMVTDVCYIAISKININTPGEFVSWLDRLDKFTITRTTPDSERSERKLLQKVT